MRNVLSLVIVFPLASWAESQEKPKGPESPSVVTKRWVDAIAKRDMKSLIRLATRNTPKRTLDILQQTFPQYQGEAKIIHEEILGARAVVVYRIENRGAVFTPEVRYDIATLVREDGQWKVSPNGGGVLKEENRPKVE